MLAERVVYIGEFKNHKKEELIQKSIEKLKSNKGHKFYYILPNGDLLKSYRQRFVREANACFEINLFTFDDIVQTILKDSEYLLIDNIWKSFVIGQVLEDLLEEGKIPYYKNICKKQGFIESVNFIIGEVKRSLVSPEDFLEKSKGKSEFKQMGIIYESYEKYIEERSLVDREGSYIKALELLKLPDNNFSDIDFIVVDEFYDFRPIEIEILKLMQESQVNMYINMPFKMDYDSAIIKNTISKLTHLGFRIEEIEKKEDSLFMDLGTGFFHYDSKKLQATDKLGLIESASSYLEIKKVFTIVKKLYACGKSLDNIGIVVLSEDYKEKLIQVSLEEKIPLAIGIQIKLIKIPFIREFLTWIEDNYKSLVKEVEIKTIDSFQNYYKLLLDLIEKRAIKDKIKNTYEKTDDFQIYRRDLLAFDKLLSILSNIEKIESWEDRVEFEDYFQILSSYLAQEKIYLKDENMDGLNIMNPLNSRGFVYDVLFVIGLSQNEYPILKSNNFLIRDEHSEILKNIGIEYWDYGHRLDNEVVKFANLLTNASEKLYLSYSSEDQGIASMFLEEIIDRFEADKIEEKLDFKKIELDYIFKNDLKEINTKEELANYLLLNIEGEIEEKNSIFAYYNYLDKDNLLNINSKLQGEYSRSLEDFNEYKGKISDKTIAHMLENLHKDKIFSASYLESYSKCPFAFFIKNILGLEEEILENDYNPLDIGSIYHEVLKSYYMKYKTQIEMDIREEKTFDLLQTLDYLKRQVIEQAKSRNLDIEKRSSILILETMYINLKEYIEADIIRLKDKKEKMIPLEFEVDFGIANKFSIDVEGKKISIRGRIDRIDKILDQEKYILIDYKSGSSGIYSLEDMRAGLSLQIPIYILAEREKNIVLGIYGQIRGAKFQVKIGLIDEISIITKASSAAITRQERQELLDLTKKNIKNIVHGIESADFSVKPKECSTYCPYKNICRYDSSMEVAYDEK